MLPVQCSLRPQSCLSPPRPLPTRKLTLIVGKLQVVIHGGHELLHEEATHIGGQVSLTVHLALQRFRKEICGVGSSGEKLVVCRTARTG